MVSKPLREKGFHLHVKDHLAHLFSDIFPTKVGKISRVSKFIRKNRTLSFRFFHLILLFLGVRLSSWSDFVRKVCNRENLVTTSVMC